MTYTGIRCGLCEALMINGTFYHETGCPNMNKVWREGEWIRFFKCRECGCSVQEGEYCDCQEDA